MDSVMIQGASGTTIHIFLTAIVSGFDDMENRYLPERVASFCMGTDWKSIMAGQHHTVALDTEGEGSYHHSGL